MLSISLWPTTPGWCEDQRLLPTSVWRSSDATRPRTAHVLRTERVWYRYHPFAGEEVEVMRFLRKGESPSLVVKLPSGRQIAVPEWMLDPQLCERLPDEAAPRVAASALLALRRLLDSQPLLASPRVVRGCAKSLPGGQHVPQPEPQRLAAETPLRAKRDPDRDSRAIAGTLSDAAKPTAQERARKRAKETR